MSIFLIFLVVVVGLGLLLVFWVIGIFNGLVRLRNEVRNAWSQIDVQLKRRHDRIPNLVATAEAYMQPERQTLENITKARNLAQNASGVAKQGQAEAQLNQALSNFYVVVENYPDLKANENFMQIQEELVSTENKIGFSRQAYNDATMVFNNRTEMFPSNIVAGMFNFKAAEFFEIEDATEREAPKVSFS